MATTEATPETNLAAASEPVQQETVAEQATPEPKQPRRRKGSVKALPRKRIVKVLSVGMEVQGKVKRISDFGAFVDIGVGRDGLLHISELSVGRVNKVTDVLNEGDEVTMWIRDLDREKNRISLTMIPPGTKTITDLTEGELVQGTVQRLTSYGAFVDIGMDRDAMLHVREMSDGYVAKPEDVVKVGEEIEARIIGVDKRRRRIDLSLKGLRPAGEAGVDVELEPLDFAVEEEEDLPSMMELAFRDAFEENDVELPRARGRRGRRGRSRRSEQQEIISRTLRYQQGR